MTLRSKDVNIRDQEDDPETHNRTGMSVTNQDHNIKFYEEFRKIFSTGYYLSQQLKQLVNTKEEMWKRLLSYEVLIYLS